MNSLIVHRFTGLFSPLRQSVVVSLRKCSQSAETQLEDEDLPNPGMKNPYMKQKKQCILCKYGIHLDYKNPRLLSQFISPFTGRLYDKHITGLCEKQQRLLKLELEKSRICGFMGYMFRDNRFTKDPRLFNPMRPQRPNPH